MTGKDTTIQEKQMRRAMGAIDTLAVQADRESLTAIRRIVEYGTRKRAELQAQIIGSYAVTKGDHDGTTHALPGLPEDHVSQLEPRRQRCASDVADFGHADDAVLVTTMPHDPCRREHGSLSQNTTTPQGDITDGSQ